MQCAAAGAEGRKMRQRRTVAAASETNHAVAKLLLLPPASVSDPARRIGGTVMSLSHLGLLLLPWYYAATGAGAGATTATTMRRPAGEARRAHERGASSQQTVACTP